MLKSGLVSVSFRGLAPEEVAKAAEMAADSLLDVEKLFAL